MRNNKNKTFEILRNKKNERFYEIFGTYECGLVLNSCDVKKIINRQVSLGGGHGWIKGGELWLRGITDQNIKILLNKWEINQIIKQVREKKYLMIPKNLYLKNHKIKMTLMLAKRIRFKTKEKFETIKRKDEKKLWNFY